MSQAVVDPAEVRRFAANLKRFNADLQSSLAGLHGQLMALGDTWRDQEHDRFRQEFESTMQVLERFLEVSADHIPFLLRKAERIEEYLSQR
jgi:uncharacterized protein YukE